MELITNIVVEYLKHNKRIVVPKLGVFIVKQPSGVVRFSDLMRNDDGVLRSLLLAYGVKELEAEGMISRFVFEIRHAITSGESYTIESFGEFLPGENNTITFKHLREPIVYGGKIKPPVTVLDEEKERLLRTQPHRVPVPQQPKEGSKKRRKRGKQVEASDESKITLVKPDAYLRGLKYDNEKKKRGDDRSDSKRRGGMPPVLIVLLIALLAVGTIWVIWRWTNKPLNRYGIALKSAPAPETIIEERDSTLVMGADSINLTPVGTPTETSAADAASKTTTASTARAVDSVGTPAIRSRRVEEQINR